MDQTYWTIESLITALNTVEFNNKQWYVINRKMIADNNELFEETTYSNSEGEVVTGHVKYSSKVEYWKSFSNDKIH